MSQGTPIAFELLTARWYGSLTQDSLILPPQNPGRIPHLLGEGNQPGTRHTGNSLSPKLCVYAQCVSLAQSFSFCFSKQSFTL